MARKHMHGIDDLIDDFTFLDDWEDRYRYVIELGRELPEMDEADRNRQSKVNGCASQVWVVSRTEESGDRNVAIAIECAIQLLGVCENFFLGHGLSPSKSSIL